MDGIKIYLAPMAGITDAAMRGLCVQQGAQMTFTEMISAKAVSFRDKKTGALMELSPQEKRVGVQLFGSEPDILADTAKYVLDALGERLYVIDINMGCPAPKIAGNGEGSALMKNPALAAKIISAVRRAVDVRLSVKFRKGWDEGSVNAVEFARMAEEAGCDAITVHGRTREQFYSGRADWDIIAAVKAAVGIEVIGNGDIFCAGDAKAMLEHTGCDAVMIARGAQGNPFVFAQTKALLQQGREIAPPTDEQRIAMCLTQAEQTVQNKGEKLAMLQMRTHAPAYTKGMKGAARVREKLVHVETLEQLRAIFEEFLGKD